MTMRTRVACALAAACASAASAQTLHLEFTSFGMAEQAPREYSRFSGLLPSDSGLKLSVSARISAVSLLETPRAEFAFAAPVYLGDSLHGESAHRLSEADFKFLGIDPIVPVPQFLDLAPRPAWPQATSFLESQLPAGPLEPGTGFVSREMNVHAVPLPPSVFGGGALLLGIALVRHRRLRA
jgi:hypothetical protein